MRQYETSFDLCLRNGIVLKLVREWSLWGMVRRWGLYETSRRRLGAWWGRSSDGSWSMGRRTLFLVLHGKKDSVINTLAHLDILTSRASKTLHSCPILFWPGFDHQCLRIPSFSLSLSSQRSASSSSSTMRPSQRWSRAFHCENCYGPRTVS